MNSFNTPLFSMRGLILLSCLMVFWLPGQGKVFTIDSNDGDVFRPTYFSSIPGGGDTIRIKSDRTRSLKFFDLEGSAAAPIVIINYGGRVIIDDTLIWGAMAFENCHYIKVSGRGVDSIHYGFSLRARVAGLGFSGLSSDCEAEFIEIQNSGFFGIVAKKDYSGNPPVPCPRFNNLIIHDNYIHHQGEGMYIGETTSPGMELRHVRIYNNVVTHCDREAIQIANCVEDIEVYNNYCSTTGLENLNFQKSSFQIGDNTVGRFYNNILINCPGSGIPLMGSGDIEVYHNFVANTGGVFIDERSFSNIPSAISLYDNYFYNTHADQVISSMNSVNEIHLLNNHFNMPGTFALNRDNLVPLWDESGNLFAPIDTLLYAINSGVFSLLTGNPVAYHAMGPQPGLTHTMNSTPVFSTTEAQYVLFGDSLDYTVQVATGDNDRLTFEVRDLPSFIQTDQPGNGLIHFSGLSMLQQKGIYRPMILVSDSSHHAYARSAIKIAFMDPLNNNPVLNIQPIYTMEAASKLVLNITADELDDDAIEYVINGLPAFATLEQNPDSAWIVLKPQLADTGNFNFSVTADDGFGHPDTVDVSLTVLQPVLIPRRLMYRVNYGGPELPDDDMNWQKDKDREPVYGVDMAYGTGSHTWNGINNTGAPKELFGPYRHCFINDSSFYFRFPLPTNGLYEINLYFAARSYEVTHQITETFSVMAEDSIVLDSFNIYRDYAYQAAKKTFLLAIEDQQLDVIFTTQLNDAKINGVEIRFMETSNNPPQITGITDILLNEAISDTLVFSINDDNFIDCDTLTVSLHNAPSFVRLIYTDGISRLVFQPGYNDAGNYQNIAISAFDGCDTTMVSFTITVNNVFENHPPVLEMLTPTTLDAGTTEDYLFSASDADNQLLTFSFIDLPAFVQFISMGNGLGKLIINPAYSDAGDYAVVIMVTDTYQASDSDTLLLSVAYSPVVERIPLNANMITDLVRPPYGSWQSAAYLVDEQNLDPMLNQHPVSPSWKPFYSTSYSPYHIYFDLGQNYVIRKVYVHDMNNAANLVFSYGTPDNWNDWFTEPCNGYVHWKLHETSITTRYIRLSEYNTISAYANEIALYGYAIEEKSAEILNKETPIRVYPNPATERLFIDGLPVDALVHIYDMTGRLVLNDNQATMSISSLHSGIYNLIVINIAGEIIHSARLLVK